MVSITWKWRCGREKYAHKVKKTKFCVLKNMGICNILSKGGVASKKNYLGVL